MGVASPGGTEPRTVAGRVATVGTGRPIPDLQVVVLDLDKRAAGSFTNENLLGQPSRALSDLPGRRIGSASTDTDGTFEIRYRSKSSESNVALLGLVLLTPEGIPPGSAATVVFVSDAPRPNPGEDEYFLIFLSATAPLLEAHLASTRGGFDEGSIRVVDLVGAAWKDVLDGDARVTDADRDLKTTRLPDPVRLVIPLASGSDASQAPYIWYDASEQRWLMSTNKGDEGITFAGIAHGWSGRGTIGIEIEPDRHVFRINAEEHLPTSIRPPFDPPSKLSRHCLKYQRRAEEVD